MKCPECGSEDVSKIINIMVMCPASHRNFSKSGIRSSDVTILAAGLEGATLLMCHDCSWVVEKEANDGGTN